jgi:hypothetical protein
VAAVAALTVGVGCSSSSKPSRSELVVALRNRYGLSQSQATCAADVLFTRFSSHDLDKIRDASNQAVLPKSLQDRYGAALDQIERRCR